MKRRVIRYLLVMLCILISVSVCIAEPRYYGVANLGLSEYGDVAVKGHPKGFANVTFTNTFTDAYQEIDDLLATGKVPFQEYNLFWNDKHIVKKSDFPFIVDEAKKYSKLAVKYKDSVECAFSGATEHMLNKKDATELANRVLEVIPDFCVYVNNPWVGKGAFIDPGPRIWNEVHGADAQKPKIGGKYIFNFDGSDVFDYRVDKIKKRLSDAEVFFIWTSQNNGRKNRNDKTPRPQRKAWPTVELLELEGFQATQLGRVKLPNKDYTIKPKADQHMVPPEKRALKPVYVFPIQAQYLELWAAGKKIIKSENSQPFQDGRRRYYFNEYGHRIVEKAKQPSLDIYAFPGKKKIGKGNPGQRQ